MSDTNTPAQQPDPITSSPLELFRRLHAGGQAILLVTHDERVAEAATRIVRMEDGRLVASTRGPRAVTALEA